MNLRRFSILALLGLGVAHAQTSALAAVAKIAPTTTYTQMVTKPDGTLEMQTAAQKFSAPGKPDIWLVGAIHIGSKPYYASLQTLLDAQDQVFFEGVKSGKKPEEALKPVTPKPDPKTPPAKPVYQVFSDALGLQFQLNEIHYDRTNWRNVDLTMEDLDKLNKAQNGGKPTQFDQVKGILDPNSPTAQMLTGFLSTATPGTKEAIKLLMVRAAGGDIPISLDPATEDLIVKKRNQTVVKALDDAFVAPNPPHSIAVFYGAKHLGDLGQTLTSKYGYHVDETRWFSAADADPKKVDATGQMFLNMMNKPKPKS